MQRSHGICMLCSAAKTTVACPSPASFNSNPIRRSMETSFVFMRSVTLARKFLSTHDLAAPGFDFRERTLVSRYSSR